MRQIAPLFPSTISVETDQIIFKKGDSGDNCYIIVSGEVEVTVPDALGNDIIIAKLSKGDFFGEISLLKRIPRTATVRTISPSKFVVVTPGSLGLIKQKAPAVLDTLTQISQRRLEARQQSPQEIVSPLRRFAMEGSSLIRQTPVDVRELISNDHHTVILGEAGAGKTTVLMLDAANQAEHLLTTPKEQVVLPVFLKLNALVSGKTIERMILELFISYEIHEFETEADVISLLKGESPDDSPIHSILFLLDGLNEIPAQEKSRLELSRFIRDNSRHRFVLSCRAQDYTALQNFRTAMLQRLAGEDIETFLVNYLRAEQGRKVAREIYNDPQLEDLAQSPLALYMFAQIAKRSQEALPKNRGILFEVFINELLERTDSEWWKIFGRSKAETPLVLRRNTLASLGWAMQEEEAWTFSRARWMEIISQELHQYRRNADPGETAELKYITPQDIHEEIKHSGLVRYTGDRRKIEFAHHTYQEFFAALALRDKIKDVEPYLQTKENRRRWQGTIILLYGIAFDKTELYSEILGTNNDYARIWLAAQCLANSGEDVGLTLNKFENSLPMEQHFSLLFSVGLASRQLGRYPEALTYLHMAVEENPGSSAVHYEMFRSENFTELSGCSRVVPRRAQTYAELHRSQDSA